QLGSEREAIEMTQTNAIQMTKVSAGALESFSTTYLIFNMPYLFESEDNYRHVMKRKNVQDAFFKSTDDQGFSGITYYDAGMRNIYTKDKKIKDNKDLKGLKIRVQPGKTSVDLIKSLGGTPTPMDYGEVYTAMQSGVKVLNFGSGHAWGMIGLEIETEELGTLILASDAIYTQESM